LSFSTIASEVSVVESVRRFAGAVMDVIRDLDI
jgi:hypothetical protein